MTDAPAPAFSFSELNPRQAEVREIIKRAAPESVSVIGFGGAIGGGKGADITTPIPVAGGWKLMGDLAVGDVVFGPDGAPANVTSVSDIHYRPCFLVSMSDGAEFIVDDEHRWLVFNSPERQALTRRTPEFRERRQANRPSRVAGKRTEEQTLGIIARNKIYRPETKPAPTGSVVSTLELRLMVLAATKPYPISIRVNGALELPEATLPIDPYLLGIWLGDGSKHGGQVACHPDDSHILQAFVEAQYEVTKSNSDPFTYGIRGLRAELRKTGLLMNKHIPPTYLRASRQQRLDLLCGLMDTDGFASKESGSVEFTTTRPELRDGTIELIRTLGWRANIMEGRATLNGRDCGPKYRIKWTPDDYVFKLERKRTLQRFCGERAKWRYVRSVEPVDTVPTRCISVDHPSHCYLAGETFTVMHNTWLDAWTAINLSIAYPGNRGIVGRDEFNKLETTTLQEFDKICPPGLVVRKYNGSPAYRDIRLAHWPKDVTSRIYFRGIANWQSFGSEEYGFVILDEASEIQKMAAVILLSRLRHRLPKVVTDAWKAKGVNENIKYVFLASSNPWPGWFSQWFADKKLDEILDALPGLNVKVHFVPSKIYDNPHLPPGYAEQQRAILLAAGMGEFADRMIEGRFDVYEGRIYERFDPLIHRWKFEEPDKKQYVKVVGGLDFGGENSLTSHYTAGLVGLVTPTGRLLRVAEFKQRGPNITDRLLTWVMAQQHRWGDPISRKIQWRADRSQSVGISIWKNILNITPSTGGMDSVNEGIKRVAARLERDAAGIPGSYYLPTLTEWAEEMRLYRRNPETLKVVKENDDLVDADRYMHELLDKYGGDPNVLLRNRLPVVA